jgi:N-acetylneuraminic acid mutarotase
MLFSLVFTAWIYAAVPQIISYQGRVAVGSVNFDGTGLFKFALVNGTGTVTYWSNDGTSVSGAAPSAAVSLPVSKGLYSVLLGDAGVTNMTPIPASVFTNEDVRLRVWFDDGVNGSQLLAPDQRIAAVGYAMMAGNVPDGSITGAKLANGAVSGAQLASGAALANLNAAGMTAVPAGGMILSPNASDPSLLGAGYNANGMIDMTWQQKATSDVARSNHTAVWTGSEMLVWGNQASAGSTNSAGSIYNPATNTWRRMSLINAPSARIHFSAVWTGSRMIIWGGEILSGNTDSNTGASYDPVTNTWAPISTTGAPAARREHTAVWTGSRMVVWGGLSGGSTYLNTGGRYDPDTDTWATVTTTGAPSARERHHAVWTGSSMIIYGGAPSTNTGGRYNPTNNSWTATSTTGVPTWQDGLSVIWGGNKMIVWGGPAEVHVNATYDPVADSWASMSTTNAPYGRTFHSAVWTGTEMMIWGGNLPGNAGDGGRYNPASDTWIAISPSNSSPDHGTGHSAVWTGTDMIIHGGSGGSREIFIFNPTRVLHLYQKP